MKTRLEHLRKQIIQCQAMVEALIDFGEDAEIEEKNYDAGLVRSVLGKTSMLIRVQPGNALWSCVAPYNIISLTIEEERSCVRVSDSRYLDLQMLAKAVFSTSWVREPMNVSD